MAEIHESSVLDQLIGLTQRGQVFGEGVAFGDLSPERHDIIKAQTLAVTDDAVRHMESVIAEATPDKPEDFATGTAVGVALKTGPFTAALTAGELPGEQNNHLLSLVCQGVGYMYTADQLMDRGDEPMHAAVYERAGGVPYLYDKDSTKLMPARGGIVAAMNTALTELGGEDAAVLQYYYEGLVLHNEARLQRLSQRYDAVREDGRHAFLAHNAQNIGRMMVADAGFQSVTAALHTVYRHNDPSLPSVEELEDNPDIRRLHQICNAVARVADERGDWWMDAGNEPAYGAFSINPFNQYHSTLVAELCDQAGITEPDQIHHLQQQFQAFGQTLHGPAKNQIGDDITSQFFMQMREHVTAAEQVMPAKYWQYLTLCKRVGEICHVNMLGDIEMSGGKVA